MTSCNSFSGFCKVISFYWLAVLFFGCAFVLPQAWAQEAKTRTLSPENLAETGKMPEGWNRDYWSDSKHYSTEKSSRSGDVALVMQADSFSVSRYFKKVSLMPKATYKLGFWIKTEAVAGSNSRSGTGVRLGKLSFTPDTLLWGTHDWMRREITFRTDDDDSMVLEFLLGKEGRAKGKVWIDDISLTRVSVTPMKPAVTVDLSHKKAPLSKYIYGQFIEHMGNSVYGGIWAEMLEDRKFYYLPGSAQSPWQFNTQDSTSIHVDSLDAFVGKYSPMLMGDPSNPTEFYQGELALKSGKKYEGSIILAGDKAAAPVDVILSWGDGKDERDVVQINNIGREYETHPLNFEVAGDTEHGRLSIISRGSGPVSIGTLSLMPSDNIQGFRPDVIALMKQLNAPVYRWPGGNFVSGYNWKDGIGDRDRREPRVDRAWESNYRDDPWNAVESNDMGIHEFMRLCEILNSEPYVAVNTGLGTARLAAEEVEYLNGDTNTPMGKWRAQNGHSDPFNIRFFAVGNEMYGSWQLGNMPVEEYVQKHNRVAEAMWSVDPDIKLVGVGESGDWDEAMYKNSADKMNYISEHFYRQDWHGGGLMTHVMQIPHIINDIADQHREWRKKLNVLDGKDIKIALDEWNYWYGPHIYGLLGTRYFLRDALGIAAGINALSRNSDMYFMANYAQTVNVIGAIKATKTTSFLAATGVVLKTYREKFGSLPVETTGDKLPFDIAAALTSDGKSLTVSVVNPTQQEQKLSLDIAGGKINTSGTATIITGKNDMIYNSPENKHAVSANERPIKIENNSVKIPAISAAILTFQIIE